MSGWDGGGLLIGSLGGRGKILPGEGLEKEIPWRMTIVERGEGGVWIFSGMRSSFVMFKIFEFIGQILYYSTLPLPFTACVRALGGSMGAGGEWWRERGLDIPNSLTQKFFMKGVFICYFQSGGGLFSITSHIPSSRWA